jgi:tight adherence protein B
MSLLIIGVLASLMAAGLFMYALLAAPVSRVPVARRTHGKPEEKPVLSLTTDYLVARVDHLLKQSSWVPFRARELELAGVNATPGSLVVMVGAIAVAALAGVTALTGNFLIALLLAVCVPVGAKVYLKFRTGQRRKQFAAQLDGTLQMIASALRAGLSFIRALDAVASEAESPTAEEFARVVNENRIGRDLVVALQQTAERMGSEDFQWVAEAVAVHRDTGGNLNEVLDRVGQTMRERNQVAQQVAALAAEGKFSGYILMLLPVSVGGLFAVVNPDYMHPLFTETLGRILLGVCAVLYVIGGIWMRKITNVEY